MRRAKVWKKEKNNGVYRQVSTTPQQLFVVPSLEL